MTSRPPVAAIPEEGDERALIEAAQHDPRRFGELYERYFDRVYAFVARRAGGRGEAEDLTAEVFHDALANLGRFEWRGVPFGAWLLQIARNALDDRWRRVAGGLGESPPDPGDSGIRAEVERSTRTWDDVDTAYRRALEAGAASLEAPVNERWGWRAASSTSPRAPRAGASPRPGSSDRQISCLPFFDVTQNQENVTELSFAPIYRGSAREELSNGLMGAEANATLGVAQGRPWRVEALGGFRWLRLHETYTITTSSPFIPPNPRDVWNTIDTFDAFNNFYGAQLGVRARYERGPWFASGTLKFGMGAMVQTVDVNGSLVTNDFSNFGATQTFPGGYFALPSNIGSHTRTAFAVLPEVGLTIGYQFTSWAAVFVGYSFLYTNNVVRPGNQINRNINPTQSVSYAGQPPASLQGPAQPTFKFNSSDFWAQGINVGLGFRF